LLTAMERFDEAQAQRFDPERLRWAGIDPGAARAADRVRKQLLRTSRVRSCARPADIETPILQCILAGYPDRVARRVRGSELALAAGGTASLSDTSVVREGEFLVAVDAEGRGRKVVVRMASSIRPDWLLEMFPDAVRESRQVEWNAQKQRVEVIDRLQYGSLVLDESRDCGATGDDVSRVLWEAAQALGPAAFSNSDTLDRWMARVQFVVTHAPDAGLPAIGQDQANEALEHLCKGRRSFEELRQIGLLHALQQRLDPYQRKALDNLAPDRMTLPGGRSTQVHYECGRDPWIESRLQDFFGMQTGPSIAGGRFPLVLHLLAPNQRAVQVTRDLLGFWERHYPSVRRELCRKYPRHPWPEDGRTATPPPAAGRR
jgi:ATP-dependent helicase HrpB